MPYEIEPIGFFQSLESERYAVARQPGVLKGNQGKIILNSRCNFETALEDLNGFDRIFVIYRFHLNDSWKPKVLPPRGDKKRGVFATRSPHRPNFLGLSCLELTKIEGLTLHVVNHDLLDGTPIFDIKPYIVYADAFPNASQGWLGELEKTPNFLLKWETDAEEKRSYLDAHGVDIQSNITPRLITHPFPRKQNRVLQLSDGFYEVAYKTWRLKYSVDISNETISIYDIYTGYDKETLNLKKKCPYNDLELHIKFNELFREV